MKGRDSDRVRSQLSHLFNQCRTQERQSLSQDRAGEAADENQGAKYPSEGCDLMWIPLSLIS